MKLITYDKESSALELVRIYNKAKKERLKMIYAYEHELSRLLGTIEAKQRELVHMAVVAQSDRENADGMSYNEALLSVN